MKKPGVVTSFRCSSEEFRTLVRNAKSQGETLSEYIRKAIAQPRASIVLQETDNPAVSFVVLQ